MSGENYHALAIGLYMVAMLLIGWYAYRRTANLTDYMLGGRSFGPAVTALSAFAADMSAWLLMGLPGAIYLGGLGQAWIAIGLLLGSYLSWKLIAPRLRVYTQVSNDSITIPSFLESRLKDSSRFLRILSALIILVFFTFYVSSGMVAGGIFFESSFGLNYHTGLLLVTFVVLLYTLFGGFLAVSYTDFVQALIMVLALIAVPIIGVIAIGGLGETAASIRSVDPKLLSLFSGTTFLGVISTAAWGLGHFGQPHILVRFMAINSVKETKSARKIAIACMIFGMGGAIATALVGIAYFQKNPEISLADPEVVFIQLGQILFHPFIAGIVLAAVLAAIMSTISSQLIVTSSALIEDLHKFLFKSEASDKKYVSLGRLAVLIVTIVAAILAWGDNETILKLVSFAWAGFGASFGPIMILTLYWRKITAQGALWGMIAGAVTVFIWGNSSLSDVMYEIVPGFILNLIVAVIVSSITYKADSGIDEEFTKTLELYERDK